MIVQFLGLTPTGLREIGRLSFVGKQPAMQGDLNWNAIMTELVGPRPALTPILANRAPLIFNGPYFYANILEGNNDTLSE